MQLSGDLRQIINLRSSTPPLRRLQPRPRSPTAAPRPVAATAAMAPLAAAAAVAPAPAALTALTPPSAAVNPTRGRQAIPTLRDRVCARTRQGAGGLYGSSLSAGPWPRRFSSHVASEKARWWIGDLSCLRGVRCRHEAAEIKESKQTYDLP